MSEEEEPGKPAEETGETEEHEEESLGAKLRKKKSRAPGTDKELVCKYCHAKEFADGRPFKNIGDIGVHVKTECEKYQTLKKIRDVAKKEGPPKAPYKTEPDANKILREILENYPDIPERVIEEVMSWPDLTGQALHPSALQNLLSQMQGVNKATSAVVSQKYALALQKAQMDSISGGPGMMGPGMGFLGPQQTPGGMLPGMGSRDGSFLPGWQQPCQRCGASVSSGSTYCNNCGSPLRSQNWAPANQSQNIDAESLVRRVTDAVSKPLEEKLARIEDKISAPAHREVAEDGEEETWEPVFDNDDRLLKDANGEIVYTRKFHRSRSRGITLEDVRHLMEDRDKKSTPDDMRKTMEEVIDRRIRPLEEKMKPKELTLEDVSKVIDEKLDRMKERPLTAEDIRKTVKEELAGASNAKEDPKVADLTREMSGLRQQLENKEKEIEKEERQRLVGMVTKLEDRLEDIRRMPSGEWKSDETKLLASAIGDLTTFLKTRSPAKEAKELVRDFMGIPGAPQVEVPEEARKTVTETLKAAGYATVE